MDDDENGGDLLPLARLGASAFSPVQAASTSPPVAESTCTSLNVALCRVNASASPPGVAVVGIASPPIFAVGSPSVHDVASPGWPTGSPAEAVAERPSPPESAPRGSPPPACLAAPPGPPNGSPAGVAAPPGLPHGSPADACTARPYPPACSATPPGTPCGSPADVSVAMPGIRYVFSCADLSRAHAPSQLFRP